MLRSAPVVGPRPCILVVDEEELILSFLTYALDQYGYNVCAFRTVEEALEKLERNPHQPNVALIDLANGRQDFVDLRDHYPHLPCVLMSSDLDMGEEGELLRIGVAGILQKPFPLSAVLEMLHKLPPQ